MNWLPPVGSLFDTANGAIHLEATLLLDAHTHTHTHLFHLLLSYVSYTGEAGISGADSAFAEERWIEVDVTDSIDIRARKEHRSFFKNFLQSLGLIICSIPETRCLSKSSCTFSRSRPIFRACDIVVLDSLLASSLNPCRCRGVCRLLYTRYSKSPVRLVSIYS
jgi:hypothetical protein